MIASSVAITAVLYPHHPLDFDLLSKTFFFRGLMTLFSSETGDLRRENQSCSINTTDRNEKNHFCMRLAHDRSFQCEYRKPNKRISC
jgi:hypothetical protein